MIRTMNSGRKLASLSQRPDPSGKSSRDDVSSLVWGGNSESFSGTAANGPEVLGIVSRLQDLNHAARDLGLLSLDGCAVRAPLLLHLQPLWKLPGKPN